MKKYYLFFGEGSKINQLICALLINSAVFFYGAGIGWMSPMTLLLQSENSPKGRPLTDYEVSWMGAVVYLVCAPADYLMAWMPDKIGRKYTIFFMSIIAISCWAMKLSSMETWVLILARSCIGILAAGSYVTCPMYTKEISENSVRGMLGSLVVLSQTAGNLFSYVIGDMLSYRTILWVCISIPAVHLVLFTMMPESPSYLVKKGDMKKAAKSLAWLRCREEDDIVVLTELDQIKKEQMNDEGTSEFALKAIFSDKILFRAFKIAMIVAIAREFCGTIPVLNFAADIFAMSLEGTSVTLTPNQQAILLGTVQVVGSVLAFGIVEKAGRKCLLFMTALISGLSMMALASWFLARSYGIHAVASLPVVTLCLSIFCDAFGLQPTSVIITSEIFSYKYRSSVMATTMMFATFSAFFQALFFKPLASTIGIHFGFYGHAAVCLFAALYTIIVIPETKNKGLEEIYDSLKTKKEKEKEIEEFRVKENTDVSDRY